MATPVSALLRSESIIIEFTQHSNSSNPFVKSLKVDGNSSVRYDRCLAGGDVTVMIDRDCFAVIA